MHYKTLIAAVFMLLTSVECFGQTSFQGLTPGMSMRKDAAKVLGQPVRSISDALFEYTPPAGIAKVEVEYRGGSEVMERIEVYFLKPISRAALIKKLGLPQQAEARKTPAEGSQVEYFGGSLFLVLTYAGADEMSGVSRIGYYSRELFASTVGKSRGARENPGTQSGSSGSGSGAATGGRSASVDRTGNTSTFGANSSAPSPGGTKRTTTTTRSDPWSTGSPVTATTRSGGALEAQPSNRPNASADNDADSAEKEISLSAAELRRLVGRYEFIQTSEPELKFAVVALVAEKLKLTMGATSYTLVPVARDDFVAGGRANSAGINHSDAVNFKIANKPGLKVRFLISEDKVQNLFIVEEQSEPLRFFVAVPKP
jgi:hypothetical protein